MLHQKLLKIMLQVKSRANLQHRNSTSETTSQEAHVTEMNFEFSIKSISFYILKSGFHHKVKLNAVL